MIGMSFANSYALAQGCDMDNRVHSESRMVCLGMLKKMTLEHIKELMKSGDVKVAAAELQKLLAAEPDNAEAKMLYGTCCHLLGDDATFKKIHDELAPKMKVEKNEKNLSLWQKYCNAIVTSNEVVLIDNVNYAKAGQCLMEYLVIAGLIIVAIAVAVWLFGGRTLQTLYGGPGYDAPVQAQEAAEQEAVREEAVRANNEWVNDEYKRP